MSLCIKALRNKEESFALISDIQSSLTTFGHIVFAHTRKLGNALTQNLARPVSDFLCQWKMFHHTLIIFSIYQLKKIYIYIYYLF